MSFRAMIVLAAAGLAAPALGDNILALAYGVDGNQPNLRTALVDAGHNVTFINNAGPGQLAGALNNGNFDQVFFWDVTTSPQVNQTDLDALANWRAARTARESIFIDGRSYGIIFQFNQDQRERQLIANVAAQFSAVGGGVWIGTDHDSWAQNGNLVLQRFGFNTITGTLSSPVSGFDPNSPFLTGPFNINPNGMWIGSVGRVPTGVQPNGITLDRVFWDSQNNPLASGYLVPAPGAAALAGLGLLSAARRRRD